MNLELQYLLPVLKIILGEIGRTECIVSEMSSFLPSIDSVGKSSLVAAKRIYSALDYLEAASNGRSGKKRPGHKKSKKLNPHSTIKILTRKPKERKNILGN